MVNWDNVLFWFIAFVATLLIMDAIIRLRYYIRMKMAQRRTFKEILEKMKNENNK